MSGKSVLEVSAPYAIRPRMGLSAGIDEPLLRVLAVDGTRVTVVRWRWWHTLSSRLRTWPRKAGEAASVRWCAMRGHPFDGEYCRCGARENPDWLDEWEDLGP
ncbi:MAG TPA: hypothetical protein VGS19_02430 [Streptosporangiaceae bacterium]|nr:hypothetical protein [Streptosporangiaceae bacterium]